MHKILIIFQTINSDKQQEKNHLGLKLGVVEQKEGEEKKGVILGRGAQ